MWIRAALSRFEGGLLFEDERLAALPVDEPLAGQAEVIAPDLADEPFVWVDETDERVRDYWTLGGGTRRATVKVGARNHRIRGLLHRRSRGAGGRRVTGAHPQGTGGAFGGVPAVPFSICSASLCA